MDLQGRSDWAFVQKGIVCDNLSGKMKKPKQPQPQPQALLFVVDKTVSIEKNLGELSYRR